MFAARQQEFILTGLPVDENEKDVEGKPLVQSIGARMQKELFANLPEAPVKTQKEEVERRYKALRNAIEAEADPATKRRLIAAAVVPLARSWSVRDELQRKINDPKVGIDALLAPPPDGLFEAAFKEALDGKTASDQELGIGEWRQAVAHVLYNLSDNPDDHRRTLAVVGLEAYTHEVDSQATALQKMIPDLRHALEADMAAFEVEHKSYIEQIVVLADRVRHLESTLQTQQSSRQRHQTLLAARQADVQNVRAEIADAQKAAQNALAGQTRLEQALFRAQQAIAAAEEKNLQLQQQIAALELGR